MMQASIAIMLTEAGLLSGLAGVVLLVLFGMPPGLLNSGTSAASRTRIYRALSYLGLVLVALGFWLQYIGLP